MVVPIDITDIKKTPAVLLHVQFNANVFENLNEVNKNSLKSDINKIYTK